jgi:putative membrane-bound dehydrogenase-like protein
VTPSRRGGLAALAFLGLTLPASAQPNAPELSQYQSPPRPAPAWLKYADLGKLNPRLKGYTAPEGFKVEIVAEEPAVVNPVGMAFDTDGTLFILEWRPDPGREWLEAKETVHYKDGTTRQVTCMKKYVKDVLKVLRYNPAKGAYDRAELVLEDELPSSILLHDGWIYLSGRGTIRRYKQSRPGGPYDVKEVIAQGFCGFHHHQVSGMTIGPDGWLYVTSGDDDNIVEGSDGTRATALRTGAVFRLRPDGSHVQLFSLGYRNPYRDLAFDTSFHWFHADNDNEDGSKYTGCRLMHVAEEADFGWRLLVGARCCKPDNSRGAIFGERPGRVPALLKTGRGSPAGLLIYNDTRFPEDYRGLLIYPDVFRKLIRAYKVEPTGSTFAVTEEFEFLKSEDPLFRPCETVLGPDGAIYVCDWRTDSGGAGRLWGDGVHGRIYRITWAGTADQPALPPRPMDSWQRLARGGDADLLKALAADDFSDRLVAQRELVRRGDRSRADLLRLVADHAQPAPARMMALGALQSFWNAPVRAAFLDLLDDPLPDLRRLAADGLSLNAVPGDADAHAALLKILGDPDPAVRRAVALAIGRINAPGAADALANALKFDDGRDVYLTDGYLRAVERTGKAGVARLIDLALDGSTLHRDKAVAAFIAARSREAAEAIPGLLANPHLSPLQRADLIRSYGNYEFEPPLSLDPLIDYLAANPHETKEVKVAALETLSMPGLTRGERLTGVLAGLLGDPDEEVRVAAYKAVEESRVTALSPALIPVLSGPRSAAERTAVVKALRVLGDRSAVPELRALLADGRLNGTDGLSLRIESLRTLALLDAKAGQAAAEVLLDQQAGPLTAEAVQVLGTQPAGAKFAADRFLAGKLPKELLLPVCDGLRRHMKSNPDLRKPLEELLKGGLVLSLEPRQVERVKQLVLTQGNPQRGRALFANAKALTCITCHKLEGIGGSVGPDLTRAWDTQSVEKLMESIIQPSKEIKEGYQAYVATTAKGVTYTGLKVSDTATELVLRDPNGRDIRLAKSDLDEVTASKVSLMPENSVSQLSFEQYIDLLAFLKDRKAQESLRGTVKEFAVLGPLPGGLETAHPAEARPDPSASYGDGFWGPTQAWQARPVDASGALDLSALAAKGPAMAYALAFVYSPKDQRAELLLASGDPYKLWVGGKPAGERPGGAGEERVAVALKPGWTPVLVKVADRAGLHGLSLRVTEAEGVRVAVKPEK